MVDKKEYTISPKALFRYSVLAEIKGLERLGHSHDEAIRLVVSEPLTNERGHKQAISKRTIERWQESFDEDGLLGLEPAERQKLLTSKALSNELVEYFINARHDDNEASIPELIERARASGVAHPTEPISRVSVWRLLCRQGLSTSRHKSCENDQRRFAKPHRMQIVLADFLHFRAGPTRAKRLAVYLLDDATRFCLGVSVCTKGEKAEVFLKELHNTLLSFGLMDALYLDRGPAFKSKDTERVLAQLDIGRILGRKRYPQGHGKIERFNQSARKRLLRSLDGSFGVDPNVDALTLRLRFDAFKVYNHRSHESLNQKSPYQCFYGDQRPLNPAPTSQWLTENFTINERRKVTNDNTISFKSTDYEMPRGYARKWVTIKRRILEDNNLHFMHQGKLIRLHPVDYTANADGNRARNIKPKKEPKKSPAKSASSMLFERHTESILDSHGGFSLPNKIKGEDNE